MRIVNSAEVTEIENKAMEEFGFSSSLIIENVGLRGAEYIEENYLQERNFGEIVLLVGRGNNGADALAIGRYLNNMGHAVRAFMLFPEKENMTPELIQQRMMAEKFGVKISEIKKTEQIEAYFDQTQDEYLVIDGILGMGLRLPLSNYLFDLVNIVNNAETHVISLDVPTGICGNSGNLSGNAILADTTLAIGLPKTGHFIGDGAKHSGELVALDVGFPRQLLQGGDKFLLTPETPSILNLFRNRNKFAHKNTFGHTLIVGGSTGLTGAVGLCAQSASRVGTGLVTASTWIENFPELTSRIPMEIMTGVIPENRNDIDAIIKDLNRWDSIVIGPGIGRTERARGTVLEILNHYAGPVVVDADAIHVLNLKEDEQVFLNRKFPTVLTPHIGEFAHFIGVEKEALLERPLDYLSEVVENINCSVVLKGASTYLGFPSGDCFINYFPNDGMASGGSGDVLAGIIGGLLAQNVVEIVSSGMFANKRKVYDAICLGVVVHTLAGKHAAHEMGSRAMTAANIVDYLSNAFLEIDSLLES